MALGSIFRGVLAAIALATFEIVPPVPAAEPPEPQSVPQAEAVEFFEKHVRPVLAERCLKCHGPEKRKGGLRLDSREAILLGGDNGPAAIAGKADDSLLIDAVKYGETVQMPPKSRLPAGEVSALVRWVDLGLPWPSETTSAASAGASYDKAPFDLKARRDGHWAWQAIRAHAPPEVNDSNWPANDVDRFILARLEAAGLKPAGDTSRRTLIRRLSFDLTGLPPSPEEIEAFEGDARPDALERVVDRLLGSPRFGVRWARHWLDLVRYAETRGHEFDPAIPNAWQYRDYVVRALNADVPYDQFILEHIAGDLLERRRIDAVSGANESVLGTGFWFLGEEVHSPVDIRQDESDRLDNRLDVMTKTFLGLTVACARCHDHKFDAISQRDYYALSGFLISSSYRQARFATMERERKAAQTLQTLRDEARGRILALAARAARPGIERLARDLLDARCRLLGEAAEKPERGDRAGRWAAILESAKADPRHPFHAFASIACDSTAADPAAIRARLQQLSLDASERDAWASDRATAEGCRVIVDYSRESSLASLQNGASFGLRPSRPGDLIVTGPAANPVLGLVDLPSARRDRVFAGLAVAQGTERDHGRLGGWDRAGQTLRSPEFTIGSGRLWYLAKGAGRVHAVVNSHLLIAGPLHGALLTEWTDGERGWRWVRHDLTGYEGHRTHLEFSPAGKGDLAIALVVESEQEPMLDACANRFVRRTLAAGEVDSLEDLARAYQVLFSSVLERMQECELGTSREAHEVARLAEWVLRNVEWFGAGDSTAEEAIRSLRVEAGRLATAEESLARELAVASATAPAMWDGTGVDEHLLVRGSTRTPGPKVPRRFIEALSGDAPIVASTTQASGRLELARQMIGPSNPLASRVIVNRIWHHLFGRGIVASVDNLGVLGDRPTHPELLDHLAREFIADGWSIKKLIRALVLSRTYRMSIRPDEQADAADPGNRLMHRMSVRKLEAEPIRDAMLFVSGGLDERMAGPGVPVHLTPYMQGRGRPSESGPLDGDGRRSLYLAIHRNFLSPMLLAFDAPIPFTTIGRRNVSNVPAQALILMNDPFVAAEARRWARRIVSGPDRPVEQRISTMYRAALGRPPEQAEVSEALAFLASQARELGVPADGWQSDERPWADLAHVLFNSKEFLFLP
jgi:hypothetical protein